MNRWDEPQPGEMDMIADAARTYPLAPVPPGLTSAIQSRIGQANPRPRLQVRWIDAALGLLGAGMTGLAWLLFQWLVNSSASPLSLASAYALISNALGGLEPLEIALGALGIFGGLLALGLCLVLALVVLVPRPIVRMEPISR